MLLRILNSNQTEVQEHVTVVKTVMGSVPIAKELVAHLTHGGQLSNMTKVFAQLVLNPQLDTLE
jgi:hypothetical protein